MSKRKRPEDTYGSSTKKHHQIDNVPKHTLDSDEEEDGDDDNRLDMDTVEGEEDGTARQDDGQRLTAFNMKEEMEEGHFDKDGHFIWSNEKEIRDNWLENIDWQQIKQNASFRDKYNVDVGLADLDTDDSDDEPETEFNELQVYEQIKALMQPKENINKAIKRLSGSQKLSSMERLRRKRLGLLETNEDVIKLTELANRMLTRMGNMDVYQETYEQIEAKIQSKTNKEPELDMYADDFDSKEQQKMTAGPSTSHQAQSSKVEEATKQLQWEFKWKADDEDVQGPHSNAQMLKWAQEDYFKTGVMVRKCGENGNFYSSNRIDFELFE